MGNALNRSYQFKIMRFFVWFGILLGTPSVGNTFIATWYFEGVIT